MTNTHDHTQDQDARRRDVADTSAPAASPTPAVVAAAVAILAAAWFAAGSVGLMGEAFARALSWTALGAAVVLMRPTGKTLAALGAIAALLVGLPFVISTVPSEILALPGYDLLLVVAISGILAATSKDGPDRRALMASATAVAAFALFRIACDCIPTIWHAADWAGHGMGNLVAATCGRELWLGSSFAGLDFLVAMVAFSIVWLRNSPGTRWTRVLYVGVAIAIVQFAYLLVLAHAENLIAALPELPPPPSTDPADYRPPDWSLSVVLRGMIPWNLPLVALAGNLLVATCMLRWVDNSNPVWHDTERSEGREGDNLQAGHPRPSLRSGPCHTKFTRAYLPVAVVAALAAVVLTYAACPSNLADKKIVAYADGNVWMLPEHDGLDLSAADGYGMLESFVASLGGKFAVSRSLTAADLQDADVLIMIDPVKPLPEETLAGVHDFVRGGGSLLLLTGPASQAAHDRTAVDAILEPTGMGVRFDVAVAKTPHWQDSVRAYVHPSTVAVNPRRNQFALSLGSSIAAHGGGQPILVGRWGWCEPGSDTTTTGAAVYGQGEKLGDVVLAAEHGLGAGTIVVLSDTTGLTNVGLVGSHPFVGRLLGYLASGHGNPRVWWRQLLGLALLASLVWFIVARRPKDNSPAAIDDMAVRLAVTAVVFAIGMAASAAIGGQMGKVLPDGRQASALPIAYIDAAHYGINSDEPWVPRGTGGFAVTLMRNGYMPLALFETADEYLDSASMLVIAGPGKPFATGERESIERFVQRGGMLVCAIGAEESCSARGLLADFRFIVPHSPVAPSDASPEPAPMGRYPDDYGRVFRPYLNAKEYGRGDYLVHTCFHQPWPVECNDDSDAVSNLAYGYQGRPIVIHRQCEKGHVVVIGDSHFVLNENLGYVDGRANEYVQSNLDFWRWCLGRVTGGHDWFPPNRSSDTQNEQTQPPDSKKETSKETAQEKPAEKSVEQPQQKPKEKLQKPNTQKNPLRPAEVKP